MSEIVFYYNPMSRARTVHWMLEEVGAPYRLELVRLDKNEHKTPAFLALNPMGKLPTLVHGGTVVTESAAICAYLADAFPAAGLAPAPTDPRRGTYYRWLFFAAGCLEPAVVDKMFERPAARPTSIGYGTYDDTLNTLEQALAPGPYLTGDTFTAADLFIASQLAWALMAKGIEPRPAFTAFVERTSQRPAFQKALKDGMAIAERLKAGA